MQVEFAPMEGVTSLWYRRVHRRWFGGVARYYTPFLSPTQDHVFPKRELREIAPAGNEGVPLVPQLLTRRGSDFLWAANALADMGYEEVNLNLGCPSGTVTAKGKGAGFLAHPVELEAFLEEIFARCPIAVSIKTRLGIAEPEEFWPILELYNRFPVKELIIHPRVQRDQYKNRPRREVFAAAAARSRAPVCYNGDLYTTAAVEKFWGSYPGVDRVMLGRGLVGDPALARKLAGGPPASREELEGFLTEVYEGYTRGFGSRHSAMLRMKELWCYLICLFRDGERHGKAIRKAKNPEEYEARAAAVFRELELLEDLVPDW
nr:tRNA-dihydrouridine synthase family protein [uncultured Flavonifractor sp.]